MASLTRGRTATTVSGEAALNRVSGFVGGVSPLFAGGVRNDIFRLRGIVATHEHRLQFELEENSSVHRFRRSRTPGETSVANTILLAPAADQGVVNDSHKRPPDGRYYLVPIANVRNHLGIRQFNARPTHHSRRDRKRRSMAARVVILPNSGGIQAIGRHVLFEVFNARSGSRLLFEFTRGPLAADGQALPPAEVIGDGRSEIGFVGYGAARLLSAPRHRADDRGPHLCGRRYGRCSAKNHDISTRIGQSIQSSP